MGKSYDLATSIAVSCRFVAASLPVAYRLYLPASHESEKSAEEWLLIERPKDENEPAKYWLSTLPRNISFRDPIDAAKLRRRIERDYQELKQEVGVGHFEGRSWRGFHHHATLCIAAYGFLVSERETSRMVKKVKLQQERRVILSRHSLTSCLLLPL
jgi:SRSO17 transposase